MLASVVGFAVGFLLLSGIFVVVERWSRTPGRVPWWRRPDRTTDLAWWVTTPLLTRATTFVALAAVGGRSTYIMPVKLLVVSSPSI